MSRPPRWMVPATRGSKPSSAFTSVDLPAPLVPAMVTISPGATARSIARSAAGCLRRSYHPSHIGFLHTRVVQHRVRVALGQDGAPVHHDHAVGQRLERLRVGGSGHQVLVHREALELARNLKGAHQPQPRAAVGGHAGDVMPLKLDLPRIRWLLPGNGGKQRALARTVGARNPQNLTCVQLQRHPVHRLEAPDLPRDGLHLQHRCCGHWVLPPNRPLGLYRVTRISARPTAAKRRLAMPTSDTPGTHSLAKREPSRNTISSSEPNTAPRTVPEPPITSPIHT